MGYVLGILHGDRFAEKPVRCRTVLEENRTDSQGCGNTFEKLTDGLAGQGPYFGGNRRTLSVTDETGPRRWGSF